MSGATDIIIRKVESSELDELLAIGKTTFTESFASQNTKADFELYMSKNFSREKFSSEYDNPHSRFFFACQGDEIVGYLKINVGDAQTDDTMEEALEVERIYVLAQHQGKRIGQLLFDKAIELAIEEGYKRVWLGVWDKNVDAIRFYERNGFFKYSTHPFKLGDDDQTDILMKLEL